MRSLWTGSIGFGLVNIPVSLYSATANTGLELDMLHKKDLSPIRYAKICKEDGQEIPMKDIVKGAAQPDGEYVVLTDEDFVAASAKKSNIVDIVAFTDVDEVDSIYYEKPYYLEPGKNALKPYILLREALKQSRRVAIARFVMRNREHLALIKPAGNVLVLNQMRFYEELRQPDELNIPEKSEEIKAGEIKMALALIDQLTQEFKPREFKDTYTDDLKEVIAEKAKGHQTKVSKDKSTEPSNVKDIMSLLQASLSKSSGAGSKSSKSNDDKETSKSTSKTKKSNVVKHGPRKVS